MVKYASMAAAIALAGCAGTYESRLVTDETQSVHQRPQVLRCRLGDAPVCKMSGEQGREKIETCECMQVPYSLTGVGTFGTRRTRH